MKTATVEDLETIAADLVRLEKRAKDLGLRDTAMSFGFARGTMWREAWHTATAHLTPMERTRIADMAKVKGLMK